MTSNYVTVYGNMDWFSIDGQPEDANLLPPEMIHAKNLWDEDGEENFDKIVELVSPYVKGNFVADNIPGWRNFLIENENGVNFRHLASV